jgi:hypothetical protein
MHSYRQPVIASGKCCFHTGEWKRLVWVPKWSLIFKFQGVQERIAQATGSTIVSIPFSAARVVETMLSSSPLITGLVDAPSGIISIIKNDVKSLARKLQNIDLDTLGILRSYGILSHLDPTTGGTTHIEVVYQAPVCKAPTILRQHLLDQKPISLSTIVRNAKQLVRSVSYIHICDFVHKNIWPEKILVFSSDDATLGSTFLLVFN